mgnify:CR=1 FL=1
MTEQKTPEQLAQLAQIAYQRNEQRAAANKLIADTLTQFARTMSDDVVSKVQDCTLFDSAKYRSEDEEAELRSLQGIPVDLQALPQVKERIVALQAKSPASDAGAYSKLVTDASRQAPNAIREWLYLVVTGIRIDSKAPDKVSKEARQAVLEHLRSTCVASRLASS